MDRRRDHFHGRHYAAERTSGPLPFLNPTTRYLPMHRPRPDAGQHEQQQQQQQQQQAAPGGPPAGAPLEKESSQSGVYHVWNSRDNRKGRHAVKVHPGAATALARAPPATNSLTGTLRGLARMALRYPVWDVSYDVAVLFTLGSVVWVFNGFFAWLPLAAPASAFAGESDWGGGVTALVGATVFEAGSVLLMLEAVNENREDCFGWALEEAWEGLQDGLAERGEKRRAARGRGGLVLRRLEGEGGCEHHHSERRSLIRGRRKGKDDEETGGEDGGRKGEERTWSWWPTWYELRTHYFRDIGFLACLAQMVGATIFWVAGITGIPPILNTFSTADENGVYWLTQVVGGTGFIVSGLLFMLETQPKWYIPAPHVLGWHIGLWNLIGAIGFTLCGALGFAIEKPGVAYASCLSTFIGSWAFLIGSAIQWYESLDKYPVSIVKDEGRGLPGAES